ncbi:MAG: M48 family metalloprotease [Myxococcales bacterium]|nr:M48 family metalloprotease [Myxococcales bacterium]
MGEAIFTPEQLAEIKAYYRPLYALVAAGDLLDLAMFAVVLRWLVRPLHRLAVGLAARLGRRLRFLRTAPVARVLLRATERLWGGPGWGAAVLFALGLELFYAIALLPLDVYLGYLHPRGFGLTRYTPLSFAIDHLKGLAGLSIATSALAFGMYALARRLRLWWLVLGLVGSALLLGSAALDPYRGQVFFDREPLPEGALRQRIDALMEKAQIDFRDVVVEHTSRVSVRVQATFAGQGPTRTIILNDELLRHMTDGEVLAAVAHEAGHVRESRWPHYLASAAALLAFLFLVDRAFRWCAAKGWLGVQERADIRTLPLVALLFFVGTACLRPVTAAWRRERERQADLYALRLTGDPATFRRMLVKAARVNKMDPSPPRWVVLKGRSHPPFEERLALVDRFEKDAGGK